MSVNKQYKSTIIRKYGTDVVLHKYTGDKSVETFEERILLGRNTRNNVNMFKLTHQKEGIFLPKSNVDSGDYIVNDNHGEKYLVVGIHQEYDGNNLLSIVTGLMKCEHYMTVSGMKKVADDRGNIKDMPYVKYDKVPCYLEYVSGNLRQQEPGLNPETEYKLFVTDLDLLENDDVNIKGMKFDNNYDILALDYIAYPGLVMVEIKRSVVKKGV